MGHGPLLDALMGRRSADTRERHAKQRRGRQLAAAERQAAHEARRKEHERQARHHKPTGPSGTY